MDALRRRKDTAFKERAHRGEDQCVGQSNVGWIALLPLAGGLAPDAKLCASLPQRGFFWRWAEANAGSSVAGYAGGAGCASGGVQRRWGSAPNRAVPIGLSISVFLFESDTVCG
jgi:hypothetical protein